jgi:hypothetical protein
MDRSPEGKLERKMKSGRQGLLSGHDPAVQIIHRPDGNRSCHGGNDRFKNGNNDDDRHCHIPFR